VAAINLNEDWHQALKVRGALPEVERLSARVRAGRARGVAIAPGDGDIFRAPNATALVDVRVVILGQDPYPTPGHADGLCFSVRPGVAVPRSLRNIYREMADDLGVRPADHGSLESWAGQGVLLLNTVLTVREGDANSHAGWGWQGVTDAIISSVAASPAPVVFMLWGKSAQTKAALIDGARHLVLQAPHPSPLSARRGFFGCQHFSRANAWLASRQIEPVEWKLPAMP
jgi:uracil-DNA glycosylase